LAGEGRHARVLGVSLARREVRNSRTLVPVIHDLDARSGRAQVGVPQYPSRQYPSSRDSQVLGEARCVGPSPGSAAGSAPWRTD
jgi:hypothetical protein